MVRNQMVCLGEGSRQMPAWTQSIMFMCTDKK